MDHWDLAEELQWHQELQIGKDHPTMDTGFYSILFSCLHQADQILVGTAHLQVQQGSVHSASFLYPHAKYPSTIIAPGKEIQTNFIKSFSKHNLQSHDPFFVTAHPWTIARNNVPQRYKLST